MKLTAVLLVCFGAITAQAATLTETSVEMKTYPFFDRNPVPATKETRYPYFLFDGSSAMNVMRKWKAVILENGRTSVTMLPEIGDMVWGRGVRRQAGISSATTALNRPSRTAVCGSTA